VARGRRGALPRGPSRADVEPPELRVPLRRGARVELQLRERAGGEPARPSGRLVYAVPVERDHLIADAPADACTHRVNGVELRIDDPELTRLRFALDGSGRAVLDGLRPGSYRLRAFPAGVDFEPERFVVPRPDGEPLVATFRETDAH